ncbi:MAG TPA: VWA domain-containing protein [Ktedonobacterales bacterium]
MLDRFRARRAARYSRWDGSQELDDVEAEDLLDALADDYMKHGDLKKALQQLMRDGFQGRDSMHRMGLRDLMERTRERRQQQMQRYNLSDMFDKLKEQLEDIVRMEREGIQRKLDSAGQQSPQAGEPSAGEQGGEHEDSQGQPQAGQQGSEQQSGGQQSGGQQGSGQQGSGQQGAPDLDPEMLRRMLENLATKKRDFLDQLPQDTSGQLRALQEYEFLDEQAREAFQELLASLQKQMMDTYFQGLQQAISSMTPEDLARMRDMIHDLNQMLHDQAEGKDVDFDSFMEQYGDMVGPGVNSLDDLMQQMARRQAAMQAVLDSMSKEQRAQLFDMMDGLIGESGIGEEISELAMNMEAMYPTERSRFRLTGDEPLSLAEARALMETLQEMERLEDQMAAARRTGNIEGLDPDQLRDLVGGEEAQALEQLQRLMRELEEQGLVKRQGDRYELTSRGARRIGQKALDDLFANLRRDAFGQHRLQERGSGGERDDDTKPYAFGDPFHLHLGQTVMNALEREGPGTPVQLKPVDFEVYRARQTTRTSTVLMLDMSWSMLQNELWHPAKKVAIALESLIRSQFPRDELHIVGFSSFAQEYQANDLIELSEFDHVQGTNMVHGLMLARKILGRSRGANKQIIMITDGGPTVWMEGGRWVFDWPPHPDAVMQTLREVRRCAREGVTMNVFMLWDEPYLKHFVNQMATVNRGRAFYANPEKLGQYVLVDYLNNKQKRVS